MLLNIETNFEIFHLLIGDKFWVLSALFVVLLLLLYWMEQLGWIIILNVSVALLLYVFRWSSLSDHLFAWYVPWSQFFVFLCNKLFHIKLSLRPYIICIPVSRNNSVIIVGNFYMNKFFNLLLSFLDVNCNSEWKWLNFLKIYLIFWAGLQRMQ